MAWVLLIGAGVLESVWAVALSRTENFTNAIPTIVFLAALALSMVGLSLALKDIPLGTAYAVWVGIGAALTVAYEMVIGHQGVSFVRIALIVGLVSCVIGLKLVG